MTCKLIYFDFRALGEPIRMMLTYNEIPFEDVRLDRFGKDWIEKKADYPMGQLPVLEIDGLKLYQSKVICRYLAKKTDLYGIDDKEQAEIDTAVDIIYDLIMKMRTLREIDDPTARDKKYENFKGNAIPFFLKSLNDLVKTNKGYLACQKLTWADFYLAGSIEYLQYLCKMKFFENYPDLESVVENVYQHPKLKKYMSMRTNTDW